MIRRLQADDQFSAAGETLKGSYLMSAVKDPKTWIGSTSAAVSWVLLHR